MKWNHFCIALAVLFAAALYVTALFDAGGSNNIPDWVGVALGRILGGIFIGALLWSVVRLVNKDNPPDAKKYLIVTTSILLALNYFVESNEISRSEPTSFMFTVDGCEYSVEFPKEPEYQAGFDPAIGEYTRAQYTSDDKTNGLFLRSECIPVDNIQNAEINTKEFLNNQIVSYAESNGLQNAEYHYGENNLGKYVHVKGFKTLSRVPVTFETYIYVGDRSFVSLYAGGVSASYPQNLITRFFKSLHRE